MTRVLGKLLLVATAAVLRLAAEDGAAHSKSDHDSQLQQSDHGPELPQLTWRVGHNAGANVLFLLLRSLGLDTDYRSVLSAMHHAAEGTTLEDIRQAGQSLGVALEAYRVTPEALEAMDLPMIVHLDPVAGDFRSGGRFVLLVEFDRKTKSVIAYDAVSGLRGSWPMEEFLRMWSESCLGRQYSSLWSGTFGRILSSIGAVMMFLGLCAMIRRRVALSASPAGSPSVDIQWSSK